MLFNSLQFALFFPVVTLLYFLLPHKFRWLHLLVASCIFYTAFIPVYLLILIFTIIIDYIAGIMIENSTGKQRKNYLIISLIANIGVLAVFKYYNFFIDNMNALLLSIGMNTYQLPLLNIILPIGLSFHTFQAMSYTIEVYRGHQKAERHFGIYALYVMFYPQLVAGPIERPQNLLFQFREKKFFESQAFVNGIRLMAWGFFKKLVIADRIAQYVSVVYDNPGQYHYLNLVLATCFFAIQIYCDFSGYSDIAIGAAETMGFKLMTNFNRPYFAKNIQEFWKRWHISLSTWFKDYVYISLGGNKVTKWINYRNLAIVFLLSGFWHGANWTYIIWGAIHAACIIIYLLQKQFFNQSKKTPGFIEKYANILLTTSVVTFSWIFFRATNVDSAFLLVKHIFIGFNEIPFQLILKNSLGGIAFSLSALAISFTAIFAMFIIEKYTHPDMKSLNKNYLIDVLFISACITSTILVGVFQYNSFIYFQF
ncbi:MAG: MBOAT family O-acyltransferase [Chitinophagaceae bacterium]